VAAPQVIRVRLADGFSRDSESANFAILEGLLCSLLCMECAVAEKTGHTNKIPGAAIGNGAHLLAILKTEAPEVYRKLVGAAERLNAPSLRRMK